MARYVGKDIVICFGIPAFCEDPGLTTHNGVVPDREIVPTGINGPPGGAQWAFEYIVFDNPCSPAIDDHIKFVPGIVPVKYVVADQEIIHVPVFKLDTITCGLPDFPILYRL